MLGKMYTPQEFDENKTKVLKYILYKKRTEQEIKTKFGRVIEEELLDDIIEYLKEAKYIDDSEYIEKTIHNYMILKNLSMREIQYKLQSKGINKNDIENYFSEHQEELQEYEEKSSQNIAFKKSSSFGQEEIKQYLMKKGYRQESIRNAFEEN